MGNGGPQDRKTGSDNNLSHGQDVEDIFSVETKLNQCSKPSVLDLKQKNGFSWSSV